STDTSHTATYTLSLHDALPICQLVPFDIGEKTEPGTTKRSRLYSVVSRAVMSVPDFLPASMTSVACEIPAISRLRSGKQWIIDRSEEHTSELQSRENLVCRLLL